MIYAGMILCMTLMGSVASIFFKKASESDGFLKMLSEIPEISCP